MLKIGILIADEQEYTPMREWAEKQGGERFSLYGDEAHRFLLKQENGEAEVVSVLCGIGKVNAAAAAAHLISRGAEVLLNSGLSGGISGVRRGAIAFGSDYVEHDFDLTPLGFEKGQKPGQEWRYRADPALLSAFEEAVPGVTGPMACGDAFIADEGKKRELARLCGAVACDMESAAAASVCKKAGIPFLAVRRISDDASDTAAETYREMNDKAEDTLVGILRTGILRLLETGFQS